MSIKFILCDLNKILSVNSIKGCKYDKKLLQFSYEFGNQWLVRIAKYSQVSINDTFIFYVVHSFYTYGRKLSSAWPYIVTTHFIFNRDLFYL